MNGAAVKEIIQLWINTPAKHKMDELKYFPLAVEEVPNTTSADGLKVKCFLRKILNIKGRFHLKPDVALPH